MADKKPRAKRRTKAQMREARELKEKSKVSKAAAEVTTKLPKNPNSYTYRGDEMLSVKASEFLALAEAIELSVQNGVDATYPTAIKYIATATGIDVPNPSAEEIKTGAVRPMMDIEGTFNKGNLTQNYQAWLVPKVIDAKTLIFEIHARNVEEGNAVEYTILQKEAEEKAKADALLKSTTPPGSDNSGKKVGPATMKVVEEVPESQAAAAVGEHTD